MDSLPEPQLNGLQPVRVRRIMLTDFRSYKALDLAVAGDRIVLTGRNGAGKTNLLEALSLFAPGRGLRRAELAQCAREAGSGGWSASIEIQDRRGASQLGTGLPAPFEGAPQGRRNRIDRAPVGSSGAFAERIRVIWLTPEMDLLFVGPPGERRKFLDRMVLAIDPNHAARTSALERAARSRNRLLESSPDELGWLDAVEREIAELSVAVAAARVETLDRLERALKERRPTGDFPWAEASLTGALEELAREAPALEAEERHRRFLRDNRLRDAAARRTAAGLQSADLLIRHGPKQIEASRCSTGEQKALLVGLLLAHAHLVADASGLSPVVLLDEAAAHFDPQRRAALYADLMSLGCQTWITGADPSDFEEIAAQAEFFHVAEGRAAPVRAD